MTLSITCFNQWYLIRFDTLTDIVWPLLRDQFIVSRSMFLFIKFPSHGDVIFAREELPSLGAYGVWAVTCYTYSQTGLKDAPFSLLSWQGKMKYKKYWGEGGDIFLPSMDARRFNSVMRWAHRYMIEILPIRRKTLFNQSINKWDGQWFNVFLSI